MLDEQVLIERAKTDSKAFAAIYDIHVDTVYRYLLRRVQDESLAQEITAATFEKALINLPRFRWTGVSIRAWLLRIARNEAISQQRRQRFWSFLSLRQPSDVNLEWMVEQDEQQMQITRALRQLSVTDQELLTLRFFDELKNDEMATVLGCSVENVYVRLHRAVKRLGKAYEALESGTSKGGAHVWQQKSI